MERNIGTHDSTTTNQGTTYCMTIRQILSSSIQGKNVVSLSNQILETIKIIGKIINKGDSHSPILYINDGSGILKVRVIIRNDYEKEIFDNISMDRYYKFFGFISPGEELMMVAQGYSPITKDFNEVSFHLISSVYTSLIHQEQVHVDNPVLKNDLTSEDVEFATELAM